MAAKMAITVKLKLKKISHIISNSNTFSTIFGVMVQFLGLFLQSEVKNMIKYHGVNFVEQF